MVVPSDASWVAALVVVWVAAWVDGTGETLAGPSVAMWGTLWADVRAVLKVVLSGC